MRTLILAWEWQDPYHHYIIKFTKPDFVLCSLSPQSAPALDNISEDEQLPPKLPMKRKSTLSSSIAAAKLEEAIGENLSQHGLQSKSAFEIAREDSRSNETKEQNGNIEHAKERPRSLPPDSETPFPIARKKPPEEIGEARPVPKPRPRTMFLKSDSPHQVLKSKTMSAENLLKTFPSVERIRSGSEIGNNAPPVPLKRAQMYRSQEGINHNSINASKESKF